MTNDRSSATWLRAGMALALVALCGGTGIAATEDPTGVDYELLVEGEAVSIRAVDRPLIHVLRDLGHKLSFEVDTDLGEEVRITVAFENRPVDAAIATLCKQVGYLVARNPADNRIQLLVLTPKKGNANRAAARPADPPGWRPSEPPPVDPAVVDPPQEPGVPADDATTGKPNRDSSPVTQNEREDDD